MSRDRPPTSPILVLALALLAGPAIAAVGSWSSLGPFGAPLRFLAIDPQAPVHLVAATPFGDVYRAIDGGDWTPVDAFADGTVCSLAASPGVFWLTTVARQETRGTLWRSIDGGATWTATPAPQRTSERPFFCPFEIVDVLGETLYVLLGDEAFRSDDGGTSWTRLDASPTAGDDVDVTAMAASPSHPERLFLAIEDRAQVTVHRSLDAGASWQEASVGLPRRGFQGGERISALAVDPVTSSTVYAMVHPAGLYRSTDGGDSWRRVEGYSFVGLYDASIHFAPADPATVYVISSSQEIYRSTDGGTTWTRFDVGDIKLALHQLAIAPDSPSALFLATALGPMRSLDAGATWSGYTAGLPARAVNALAVDPHRPGRLYAGVRLYGVLRSDDRGASWEQAPQSGQGSFMDHVTRLVVDPFDASAVYASGVGRFDGVYRSTDGGQTFHHVLGVERFQEVAALMVDASHAVYASSGTGIFKSDDRGATWRRLDLGFLARALAADLSTGDLYAAGEGVFRSTNGGRRWFQIANELIDESVGSLAVDPTDPRTLYAGTATGVYRTDDLGARWTRTALPPNLPVDDLAIDPSQPAIVYAATHAGVFRTSDRGASWKPLARASLGDTRVRRVAVDPFDPRRVYAATDAGVQAIEVVETSVLALRDGRFEVEVEWRDFRGQSGAGTVALVAGDAVTGGPEEPVALRSRDSAVVEFFAPGNWEMLLKVLDGTTINGFHWVFFAAATDAGFITTVTDTSCGDVKVYRNPLGLAAPAVTDETAFAGCDDPAPPTCEAAEGVLCLGADGRFRVEVEWTDFLGQSGAGRQVSLAAPGLARSDDSGLFYFFGENNWEVLVKVLNGCAINGRFWVFGAATTDVAYTLTVTDTATGARRVYANPLGTSAAAITDSTAFATCDAD